MRQRTHAQHATLKRQQNLELLSQTLGEQARGVERKAWQKAFKRSLSRPLYPLPEHSPEQACLHPIVARVQSVRACPVRAGECRRALAYALAY